MQNQLKLKQTQQLQLNPQLQQAIKLLQMSGLELDEAVEQAARPDGGEDEVGAGRGGVLLAAEVDTQGVGHHPTGG